MLCVLCVSVTRAKDRLPQDFSLIIGFNSNFHLFILRWTLGLNVFHPHVRRDEEKPRSIPCSLSPTPGLCC